MPCVQEILTLSGLALFWFQKDLTDPKSIKYIYDFWKSVLRVSGPIWQFENNQSCFHGGSKENAQKYILASTFRKIVFRSYIISGVWLNIT